MRRYVSEHFKLNGQPKRAYERTEALEAAQRMRQHAYRCGFCGEWHLASPKRRRRRVR